MKTIERSRGTLAALAVAVTLAASAASAAAPARPIRFDRLSIEQGLSQSSVMDILQDSRGYVWLATEEGLDRFDGFSFKAYKHNPADLSSLPNSFVWDVEEDSSGDLWIATTGGLARWERAKDRVVRHPDVAGTSIRALRFQPKGGILWVGTRDSGLLRLDVAKGEVSRFAHDPKKPGSLADDRVYALYLDRKDRLWVGTESGLDRWDAGRFVHFAADPGNASALGDGRVRALVEDDDGALWVGTSGGGLSRLDPATGRFQPFRNDASVPASLAHDQVRALLLDAEGRL